MPTLDQAARQLGISEKTLRKWMKRLELEPQRHAFDLRYFVLTPEQVKTVREARAQMPASQIAQDAPVASLEPNWGEQSSRRSISPVTPPKTRPEPLSRSHHDGLPDGWMSKKETAVVHGIPRTTVDDWCKAGKVETDPGTYHLAHGHWPVVHPITQRGLAQFYQLAHRRVNFLPCEGCPHEAE